MLRFNLENVEGNQINLEKIMKTYCKNFALISLRELAQGERLDYAYHVKLKDSKVKENFILDIRKLDTIKDVNLLLQETTVEL
jgi:hypothetical protein